MLGSVTPLLHQFMKILQGYPYKGPVEAVHAAAELVKYDLENNVWRYLTWGGPSNPEYGVWMDNLRSIGFRVQAVAWCEIFNYEEIFARVYNAATEYQLCFGMVKCVVIRACNPSDEYGYMPEYVDEWRKQVTKIK